MRSRYRITLLPAAAAALVAVGACTDAPTAPPTRAAPSAAASARALRVTTIELGTTAELSPITPAAISSSGVVVGQAGIPEQTGFTAFRWQDGVLTNLGRLTDFAGWCCDSRAAAVNSRGDIVGWSGDLFPGTRHAFLWRDGTMIDLGTLPDQGPVADPATSWATGINERGDVVGASQFNLGYGHGLLAHAFVWRGVGSAMTDLGTLPGGHSSEATAINARGDVVGWSFELPYTTRAVLWPRGLPDQAIDLGTLGGASTATAINPRGDVVGSSETSIGGARHAFLWSKGVMTDLGTGGGTYSTASGISPSGDVVGTRIDASGRSRAFLWRDGVMHDLTPSGVSSSAAGITAAGQVVGLMWTFPGNATAVIWTVK